MDEIDDMKLELSKKVGEPVGLSYYLNVGIINCLWTIVSGRRLHAQQQVLSNPVLWPKVIIFGALW